MLSSVLGAFRPAARMVAGVVGLTLVAGVASNLVRKATGPNANGPVG